MATDSVCGMKVDETLAEYQGRLIFRSNARHKSFTANPEKDVKPDGGHGQAPGRLRA